VLVLSEFDPALAANPVGFDMRNYAPKYFLINGKAFPATDAITGTAGNKLLLRYVNAGVVHHSMGVLGLRQTFVAKGGSLLPTMNHNVVAESLAPGETGDAITTVPAATTDGSKFAVYDASMMLHNNGGATIGGMLAFVNVGAETTGPDTTGPMTGALVLSPNPSNGLVDVAMTASISDMATGNANVTAAEYFIDATGAGGTGTAMTGTFGAPTAAVNATISAATLGLLASGKHSIYVRGQDSIGNWGAFNVATLNLDKTGPITSGLTLTPNPSNGSVAVALQATANDLTTGGSTIAAAEYFIGAPGANGTGTAMTVNLPAPVASLRATIPAPVTAGVISVHSQDARGNWGAFATINLDVVSGGPVVSSISANPPANNGVWPLSASQPVVRFTATMTSASSNIAAAELFIDTVGANGTGVVFVPSDGVFNSLGETAYADVPLSTINALSAGNHTIYVHGRNAAGNWGNTSMLTYLIDRTPPTFTGITMAGPNPTYGAATVAIAVNGAADPTVGGLASGVAGVGEYWIDTAAPAPGTGTPFAGLAPNISVGALATGDHTIFVRIRDVAGNWSTIRQTVVSVVPDIIFSNGFEAGTTVTSWGWSSDTTNNTTRMDATTAAALVGTRGLQVQGNNTNYVQYDFGTADNPAWPSFDARFYFNPNGFTPNTGNGGALIQDIFVARTTGGNTVFRVRYRMNAGQSQVQIQVGTGTGNAVWTNLTNAASNRIEVVWQAVGSGGPSPGTLVLYVDGVAVQNLATTSANSVGGVRLGSVTDAGNNTNLGLEYFDAFASKRTVSPLIGP
jgi:hypothetical protein